MLLAYVPKKNNCKACRNPKNMFYEFLFCSTTQKNNLIYMKEMLPILRSGKEDWIMKGGMGKVIGQFTFQQSQEEKGK